MPAFHCSSHQILLPCARYGKRSALGLFGAGNELIMEWNENGEREDGSEEREGEESGRRNWRD